MKTKDIKKGISLIVLIITIIVVILLAAVVILTLSKNNPIESAKEARFKEDVRTFQDELALYISKQYANAGGHWDGSISVTTYDDIVKYIPSFTKKYEGKFIIDNNILNCTNDVSKNEKQWCDNLNVKNKLYTELEYIESTGKQWMDIGYIPNLNTEVYMSFELDEMIYDSNIFTSEWNTSGYALIIIGNQFRWHSNGYFDVNYKLETLKKYDLYLFQNTIKLNDEEILHKSFNNYTYTKNLKIFGFPPNSHMNKYKLFGFKIEEKGILVKDYIPVLDYNNKPALYDKVEGEFYYNQGTGEDFRYKLKQ